MFGLDYLHFKLSKIYIHHFLLSVEVKKPSREGRGRGASIIRLRRFDRDLFSRNQLQRASKLNVKTGSGNKRKNYIMNVLKQSLSTYSSVTLALHPRSNERKKKHLWTDKLVLVS